MGNRCVITTKDKKVGIYLHWNGGRDSVEAFLKYCELQKFRPPEQDDYGWARFCQIASNFFGAGGLCIGINRFEDTCGGLDNGVYIIENWKIVDREYPYEGFKEQDAHDLVEMLVAIDEQQPEHMQLCEDKNNREPEFSNMLRNTESKE